MPKPKKGPRLGSGPAHQRLMLSNLAVSLFEHERIQTTEAKAKMLRPYAERLITKAKKGDVHNRRQVLSVIEDRDVVHKLFAEIAPRFSDRNGGYTRVLKIGPRNGDGAPMALVELVDGEPVAVQEETTGTEPETTGRRRRGRRTRTQEAPAAAGDVTEDVAETDIPDADVTETAHEAEAEAEEAAKGDAQETEEAETELVEELEAEAEVDDTDSKGTA